MSGHTVLLAFWATFASIVLIGCAIALYLQRRIIQRQRADLAAVTAWRDSWHKIACDCEQRSLAYQLQIDQLRRRHTALRDHCSRLKLQLIVANKDFIFRTVAKN